MPVTEGRQDGQKSSCARNRTVCHDIPFVTCTGYRVLPVYILNKLGFTPHLCQVETGDRLAAVNETELDPGG